MNKLIISKENISQALKFYKITDKKYIKKCYKSFYKIISNTYLIDKFNEMYILLYLKDFDRSEVKQILSTKTLGELFGDDYPAFITNLLLLSGHNKHIENINRYSLDSLQITNHIKRVNEALTNDIYERHYTGIRLIKMLWGAAFINMKIIEVGRLQYELCKHNPIDKNTMEQCIKIHIPVGDRLYIDSVKESITDSKVYVEKYFGLQSPKYYCVSWLLSPELHTLVKKNSNIYMFYDLFEIIPSVNALADLLEFVFKLPKINNYTSLPESTSLQKEIKKMLLSNKCIHVGSGKLK